jgi:ribosomal protein S27AE
MIDVEGVRREAGPCPRCNASLAKPILWGYPVFDAVDEYGDTVSWGGCCRPSEPAAYACGACGEEYGTRPVGWEDE